MKNQLSRILFARSIAIIGASNDPGKRGFQAICRLLSDGYDGAIYPINRNETKILGLQTYRSVLDVDGPIDVALICTPAMTVPEILNQCGKKGVSGAVILAAGFGEAGGQGVNLAETCLSVARRNNVRILGPNTNGVFNLHNRMNLVGVSGVEPGEIAVVSQSGNIALAFFVDGIRRGGVGFSTYIGVGNQLDADISDYLAHLGGDENTGAAVLYIEGLTDGRRFLKTCRMVTQAKPVVVYKAGRTAAGSRSVSSHTGSLAGSFTLARDLLNQAGATVVERSDTVLSVADGLAKLPTAPAGTVAVLSDGGGHAAISADAVIEHGLDLAEFSVATREKLAALLPPTATVANPLDSAGATENCPERFVDLARVLLEDPRVEALLITGMIGGYAARFTERLLDAEIRTSAEIGHLARTYGKAIVVQSAYVGLRTKPLDVLMEAGVPVFEWTEAAVRCIAELNRYAAAKVRIATAPCILPERPLAIASDMVRTVVSQRRTSLFEHEAKELLGAHGVLVPDYVLVRERGDLALASTRFGEEPVAMKIVSSDILHKSEAGGVKLRVLGPAAMEAAYDDLLANAKAYKPDAMIEAVVVSPMAGPGIEVIIGTTHDPVFGPVVMFGFGGILVDVLENVAFRALPISRADAEDMIRQIRPNTIFDGLRGGPPANRALMADLIVKVAGLALAHLEIGEIDLNPIVVREDGYDVVDARIILSSW